MPLRASLLVAVALALASCDATGPAPLPLDPADPAALVGTWGLEAHELEMRVTSRIDQTAAIPAGGGEGAITVSGSETGSLRYLASVGVLSDPDPGPQLISLTLSQFSSPVPPTSPDYPGLELRMSAEGPVSLRAAQGATYYRSAPDAPAFSIQDGRLTVPERTLTSDGGDEVVVGGSIAFPTVALRAGEERALPAPLPDYPPEDPFLLSVTFREDGTFRAVPHADNRSDEFTGTWTSPEPGRAALTFDVEGAFVQEYTFAVEDGSLLLEQARGGANPDENGLWAALYLARPGSFASVRAVDVYRMRAVTSGS